MFNESNTKGANFRRSSSLRSSKKSISLMDDMHFIVTKFPRSSTLHSDDIEKDIDNNVDGGYMAWKDHLEKPPRTVKVRGLRVKSTDLISGHLVQTKTTKQDHSRPDRHSTKHHRPSSCNLVNYEHCHLNERIDLSKDLKIMPYLSKQFQRMNVIHPVLHRFKTFMHLNVEEPPSMMYGGYDVFYPPNLGTRGHQNYEFVTPNIPTQYIYYT